MISFASHGKTIRHTHTAQLRQGSGLVMSTARIGTSERTRLSLDVYDSVDPTAILTVTEGIERRTPRQSSIILNHEQIAALVKAGQAFLEQYPHGIESARRLA